MTATKQQPIAGYRISDPSDPTIKPWLSDTPDDNGYTSEPLYAGAAPAAVAPQGEPVGVIRASSEMGVAPWADIWQWLEPGTKLYAEQPAAVAEPADERAAVLDAARDLIELRDEYAQKTQNAMPGNEYWSERFDAKYQALAAALAAASALEAPPGVAGRTVPRNDDERAAAQFFADNPSAALLAWPLYLARDKSPALEAPAHQCCNSWFLSLPEGRQAVLRENQWMLADAAYHAGRESRSALEAPAAPAGWKLVPVQDTPSMWTAGGEAIKSCGGHERDAASLAYKAMLAAAPQAPAAPVAVTTCAELEKLQGGAGSMATIFPADASGFPVRLYAAPAAPAVDALSQAARDVLAERARQVNAEGFSPARDDQYVGGQLAGAAASYLILAAGGREDEARAFWPWRQEWLKPGSQRRYLEKACALGLAEMERQDRAAAQTNGGSAA